MLDPQGQLGPHKLTRVHTIECSPTDTSHEQPIMLSTSLRSGSGVMFNQSSKMFSEFRSVPSSLSVKFLSNFFIAILGNI